MEHPNNIGRMCIASYSAQRALLPTIAIAYNYSNYQCAFLAVSIVHCQYCSSQ